MKHRFVNGRRGGFQLLFGLSYGMLALGYATQTTIPGPMQWLPVYFPNSQIPELLPTRIGAGLWAAAGIAGMVGAFLARPRDRSSFQALTFMPVLWGLFNALSWLVGDFENGLVAAVLYLAMGGAVMIVSGMSGPYDRDTRPIVLDGEELLPPATGQQEIIERATAAGEDADGTT